MRSKWFIELMRWELEEYLSFPILEIVIVVAIYSILNRPVVTYEAAFSYSNLAHGLINQVFLFLIFSVSVVFSHSFAGSLSKSEVKMLLSYPVKRWQLFLSKFLVLFLVLFVVYGVVFATQIYLYSLSPFEPLLYVALLSLSFELLFISTVTVIIAFAVKNEVISALVSIIFLYGINSLTTALSPLYSSGRFRILFGYFGQLLHGKVPIPYESAPTLESAVMAIVIPVSISAALLVLSFIYVTRFMEVD